MGLKETLDLLMQYPRIKTVEIDQDAKGCMSIEFFPPLSAIQPSTQGVSMLGTNDMPPDDVMMFASTPTFDEMVEAAKVKE